MSVFFINKCHNIRQNLIKKRLGGPQKMPSKLRKLCNVSKIQLKTYVKMCIQLFHERLSEKVHATIPKGIVGDFELTVFQRNFKE